MAVVLWARQQSATVWDGEVVLELMLCASRKRRQRRSGRGARSIRPGTLNGACGGV